MFFYFILIDVRIIIFLVESFLLFNIVIVRVDDVWQVELFIYLFLHRFHCTFFLGNDWGVLAFVLVKNGLLYRLLVSLAFGLSAWEQGLEILGSRND